MALFHVIYLILTLFKLLPHVILFSTSSNRQTIEKDLERYALKKLTSASDLYKNFVRIMAQNPEFRNLFYYRLKMKPGPLNYIIKFLYPPMNTLFIYAPDIGPGLWILHGFSTIIAAKSIGSKLPLAMSKVSYL